MARRQWCATCVASQRGYNGYMRFSFRYLLVVLVVIASTCSLPVYADVPLVRADGAHAHVVLPAKPDKLETLAAKELIDHVKLITGVKLPVYKGGDAPAESVAIRIGRATDGHVEAIAKAKGTSPDTFAIEIKDKKISIRGLSPTGTLNGIYALLEMLGVRWYMPGELGTVLPNTKILSLKEQTIAQTPSFTSRRTNTTNNFRAWTRRLRLGGQGPPATLVMPSVGDFEEFPERYALVDGKRYKGQLCVTNSDTVRKMANRFRAYFETRPKQSWFPIGNHGGKHCECNTCRALDPPGSYGPYTGGINVSDRYLVFVDRVFEVLGDELPNKRIALTVAGPHMCAPINRRGHQRMDVIAWTAPYCRIHGVNNPACPERMMVFDRIKGWIGKLDGEYYERGNWGNIAGPGLMFPGIHRYREDMPAYHSAGVKGFLIGAYSHWISENPSMYIAAKLCWDHTADVDTILAEFYDLYYGPASDTMLLYHMTFGHAMRDADLHAGTALDIPRIFPERIRWKTRAMLTRAMRQTNEGIYRRRIEAARLAHDYLDAFCDMIEQRNQHNYAAAVTSLEQAHHLIDQLTKDYKSPLLNRQFAPTYLDLFFGKIIRQAHERTSGRNELVAGLKDKWEFQIDPEGIGQSVGWQKPNSTGGNWQVVRAYSSNWSSYGLRYYQGDAWYRQSVEIPEQFKGRKIILWVGAVDEQASIWVNGQPIGESPAAAFVPFEMDITDAVVFGESNTVVMRTRNVQLDELGTGGIIAPVILYTPTTNARR